MVLFAPDGPGRAAEEHPRVQDLEDGVQWDKPPETKPERVDSLRVRSLRTQQRAESQCQVIPRVIARAVVAGIPLVD